MSDICFSVMEWMATGRVGASSKAMAFAACGLQNDGSYPLDPDDLNRCLMLLKTVPAIREHFGKVAAIGEVWARLIERWNEIEESFLGEAGLNWEKAASAPKTYALMKQVIGEEPGVITLGSGVSIRFS
ncbi:hypothetical protein ACTJJT_00905 [Pseudomonas sp. 22373]|uniref:hypothetical protein n=1 Tax=Pseudomonas TaxID=286 RepID=UPI000490F9DE|nr:MULTISPECIES: hypothetical protein [Pseudomonas putida group]